MPNAPDIPLDIKELLRDCILSIFWPKAKIYEFLISVDYSSEMILSKDNQNSRLHIVNDAFSRISSRPDRGFGVFQTMTDRLVNWSYFDPYYFENIKKLDIVDAQRKISRLKKAVEQRNHATISRRDSFAINQKNKTKAIELGTLKTAFAKMFGGSMTVQKRGVLFEVFLRELFNRQSISMAGSFRIIGEEIDGEFKFEGENYIVEAKWQDQSSSTGQLYKFSHKVDGKMYGRGLFISMNGYSKESISAIIHGKHIQTIFMDGEDLQYVVEERITLDKMLDYKIRAAQTPGDVYVCALRQVGKI